MFLSRKQPSTIRIMRLLTITNNVYQSLAFSERGAEKLSGRGYVCYHNTDPWVKVHL